VEETIPLRETRELLWDRMVHSPFWADAEYLGTTLFIDESGISQDCRRVRKKSQVD
jgi:hypothetical protein